MKLIKGFMVFFTILLVLLSCGTTEEKEDDGKEQGPEHPPQVEELALPSGFDNDYVLNLKAGKEVLFKKPVIRIMNFQISNSFLESVNYNDIAVEDKLKSLLAETSRFTLLGSEDDIMAVLEEQMKMGYDEFDGSEGPEMGYLKIAGYTMVAKITQSIPAVEQVGAWFRLKVSVGVALTMTNAETGEIAYTKEITAENEERLVVNSEGKIIEGPRNLTERPINAINARGSDINLVPQYIKALETALGNVVYFLEENHPIMGEVLDVDGKDISITAKKSDGIKAGDYVFIVRAVKELRNSQGVLLGFKKKVVGAAKITNTQTSFSEAKMVKYNEEEGLVPEVGDIILTLPASAQ